MMLINDDAQGGVSQRLTRVLQCGDGPGLAAGAESCIRRGVLGSGLLPYPLWVRPPMPRTRAYIYYYIVTYTHDGGAMMCVLQ